MQVTLFKNAIAAGLLWTLFIVWGCAATPSSGPTAGDKYRTLFRHRWWNYYARALSAAERRDYSGAIDDLQTALQKRNRDQRMARTYGMHFVDYFPHRELGILFWETNQLEAAEAHLESSIAQASTAKAFYFLDRVRETIIRRRMERETIQPPAIRMDAPQDGILTRDDPVFISGTVTDVGYVASVAVDDQAVFLESAKRRVDFRQGLHLPQGRHLIRVRAVGLSGLANRKILAVRVDRQGPVVEIQSVERVERKGHSSWLLVGRASDPAGVDALTVNKVPVSIPSGSAVPFRVVLEPDANPVSMTAVDRAGNATQSRFDMKDIAACGKRAGKILLASRAPLKRLGGLFQGGDHQPPTVRLNGWTAFQTVYMDKVVIEGSVRDDRQIGGIAIDGQPVNETPLTGVFTAFSSSVELDHGENVVAIAATDAAGNRTVEELVITRRTPKARMLNERLRMSILPFDQRGRLTATSDAFEDWFMQQLAGRNRFQLVDRTLLDLILQEHRINRTDLIARETALRTGRLAAADAFVSGTIIETRMGMEVVSRVVDTETAEVLSMVDAFSAARALPSIKEAAERLSLKLHREFPIVDGLVLDRQSQQIITDLGAERLRCQRRILIIQERPVLHPVTQHPLGSDYQVLGRARIVQIQSDFSKGELYEGCDPAIGPSHGVIPQ